MKYDHPFNVTTYILGLSLLVLGALYAGAPDWDIPISVIMSVFCYMFSTKTVVALLERDWPRLPLMAFLTWWTVDGCYYLYWSHVNPAVLELSRQVNWPASLALYGSAGIVWMIPTIVGGSRKTDP